MPPQLNNSNRKPDWRMGKGLEQTLLQRWYIQIIYMDMKRCSTLLIRREMQNKITIRYHLTPIKKKKLESNKCWGGCGEIRAPVHCWWECKMVQPLWRTVWLVVVQKIRNRISTWGTSLVVQWVRLCSQCRGPGFNPWSGN